MDWSRESLAEYSRAVLGHRWLAIVGGFLGFLDVLYFVIPKAEQYLGGVVLPLNVAIAGGALVLAQARAWLEMRSQRGTSERPFCSKGIRFVSATPTTRVNDKGRVQHFLGVRLEIDSSSLPAALKLTFTQSTNNSGLIFEHPVEGQKYWKFEREDKHGRLAFNLLPPVMIVRIPPGFSGGRCGVESEFQQDASILRIETLNAEQLGATGLWRDL